MMVRYDFGNDVGVVIGNDIGIDIGIDIADGSEQSTALPSLTLTPCFVENFKIM